MFENGSEVSQKVGAMAPIPSQLTIAKIIIQICKSNLNTTPAMLFQRSVVSAPTLNLMESN